MYIYIHIYTYIFKSNLIMCFIKINNERKPSYLFAINTLLPFTEASSIYNLLQYIIEPSVKDSKIFIANK